MLTGRLLDSEFDHRALTLAAGTNRCPLTLLGQRARPRPLPSDAAAGGPKAAVLHPPIRQCRRDHDGRRAALRAQMKPGPLTPAERQ